MEVINKNTQEKHEVSVTELVKEFLDTATALAILFYDGDDPDPANMEKYHYVSNAIYGDLIEEIADISGKDPDVIYQAMRNELIKEDGLAEVTVSQTLQ